MFVTVLPSAATIPIASTNSGNAMIVSASRPTNRSVQPPKNPAATPAIPPSTNTSGTENTAIAMSIRAATTTRDRMSRPSWSVPNQCAAFGGLSACAVSLASGSYGTRPGPAIAHSSKNTNSAKLPAVTGSCDSTYREMPEQGDHRRAAHGRRVGRGPAENQRGNVGIVHHAAFMRGSTRP